jgi:hypothetical protein
MLGLCIPDQLEDMTEWLQEEAQMCLSTESQFAEWETVFLAEIPCVKAHPMFLQMAKIMAKR